ncbi:hypothetical protein EUX98_g5288 [Antrodiella citrinella]|uniref:C2H2-type domain-containing protein n=1 Tax=Antrodiella citrinella TaxID=2447956 RepID=A0A4S4MSV0_9APHY|nr:hypothetical protein EUX98_g5288 [Antrodiella citrinella]
MPDYSFDSYCIALSEHLRRWGNRFTLAYTNPFLLRRFMTEAIQVLTDCDPFVHTVYNHLGGCVLVLHHPVVVDILARFYGDQVVLENFEVIEILPSSDAITALRKDKRGVVFLRQEAALVIWNDCIDLHESMYDSIFHELIHILQCCPCTVQRPHFTIAHGPFSNKPSCYSKHRFMSAQPNAKQQHNLDSLGDLGHLKLPTNAALTASNESTPGVQYLPEENLGLVVHQQSQVVRAFDFDDIGKSLLEWPNRSPISDVSSPSTSTCYSPQELFAGMSPTLTSGAPGSPFSSETETTSPSSMFASPLGAADDISDNDTSDSDSDTSDDDTDAPIVPKPIVNASSLVQPLVTYSYPMPSPLPSGGGKTKYPTDWRREPPPVAGLRPIKPVPSKRGGSQKSPSVPASPATSVIRDGRLPTNGSTPSSAFASMNLHSPVQNNASQLPSPGRGMKRPLPTSFRKTGGSPPRRPALLANEPRSSTSGDDDVEHDEDGSEHAHTPGHSAILSPISSSAKAVMQKGRKRRKAGGAVISKKQKFACSACAQTFTREADMRRHRNTACKKAGTVESIPCQYCQVPFNRGDALNRHIRTKHRDIIGAIAM